MTPSYLKNLKRDLNSDVYSAGEYAEYSIISHSGKLVMSFDTCKDMLDSVMCEIVGAEGGYLKEYFYKDTDFNDDLKNIKIIDFKNPNLIFKFPNNVTKERIANSIQLANDIWKYLGGKGKFTTEIVKTKKRNYVILWCPKNFYYMPPVVSMTIIAIRSGLYYSGYKKYFNEYLSDFVKDVNGLELFKYANSEDYYYLQDVIKYRPLEIIKDFGLYKAFKGAFSEIWARRNGGYHGKHGIQQFAHSPKLPYAKYNG